MTDRPSDFRPTVAYVVSHPIQYQAPLFRRLAQSPRLRFVAAFGCDFGVKASFDPGFQREVHFGIDLLGGYEHVFLPQAVTRPDVNRFWGLRLRSSSHLWEEVRPDLVVLHGWRTCMMWQVAFEASRRGTPYWVRGENPLHPGQALPGGWRRSVHRGLVRRFLRRASGVLTLGQANERYFAAMNVPSERFHRVPYFVDADAVAAAAADGRERRAELRRHWQLPPESFVVIAVAKLQPRKRALDLVEALAGLPSSVHVLWVGAGETEEACRRRAAELGVAERFHLTGFLPAQETWQLLGIADVFAMPSEREKWGLVINEAAAAGLPVLATDECGAAEDLVIPGATGEIIPTRSIPAWIEAIARWQKKLGAGGVWAPERARALAAEHSTAAAAAAFEAAIVGPSEGSLARRVLQ